MTFFATRTSHSLGGVRGALAPPGGPQVTAPRGNLGVALRSKYLHAGRRLVPAGGADRALPPPARPAAPPAGPPGGGGPGPTHGSERCFLFCSAFVLFDVRGLSVFKRSEVGVCSVVLFGPLALFGNSAGLFCFCSAEVWKTFLFCERCSVPSLARTPPTDH